MACTSLRKKSIRTKEMLFFSFFFFLFFFNSAGCSDPSANHVLRSESQSSVVVCGPPLGA